MSDSARESTGLLNPVDEPSKRPFGAPGFMYAFFTTLVAAGLALVANYAPSVPYGLQVVLLFVAAGFFLESLALIFFEPSLMIGNGMVHYRADKPSIWRNPPRLFRWTGRRADEEIPLSSFEEVELDYTRVPFPLPVFPFTCSFFQINRWILTLRRSDGTYYLLEVGPDPVSFRDVAHRVSEYTELPLHLPWLSGHERDQSGVQKWIAPDEGSIDGNQLRNRLTSSELPVREEGGRVKFSVKNRMSALGRGGGLIVLLVFLFAGTLAVFAGFQYDPHSPAGLFFTVIWMVGGVMTGVLGLFLSAHCLSAVQSSLCLDDSGVKVVHPLGESSYLRYEEIRAVRGVFSTEGSCSQFGLGKPTPCLEIYADRAWLYISLHDRTDMDRIFRCLGNLT